MRCNSRWWTAFSSLIKQRLSLPAPVKQIWWQRHKERSMQYRRRLNRTEQTVAYEQEDLEFVSMFQVAWVSLRLVSHIPFDLPRISWHLRSDWQNCLRIHHEPRGLCAQSNKESSKNRNNKEQQHNTNEGRETSCWIGEVWLFAFGKRTTESKTRNAHIERIEWVRWQQRSPLTQSLWW